MVYSGPYKDYIDNYNINDNFIYKISTANHISEVDEIEISDKGLLIGYKENNIALIYMDKIESIEIIEK